MSTIAYPEDGVLADGPSVARAFLHALVLKLHRLALATKVTATKVLHRLVTIPRIVVDTTLTTVATVRSRSGFGAAVSLVVTGGQVLAYALHALAIRTRGFVRLALTKARQTGASLPKPQVPSAVTGRVLALTKNPWVAGVILALALAMAGTVTLWRVARGSVLAPAPVDITLTQEDVECIMKGLYVVLGADGSVHVHGIPLTVAGDVREGVAKVAADAATQRLESLARKARPLSTLDLQAVNVVARSAVARQFSVQAGTRSVLAQVS